jgi:hypothetical protein
MLWIGSEDVLAKFHASIQPCFVTHHSGEKIVPHKFVETHGQADI